MGVPSIKLPETEKCKQAHGHHVHPLQLGVKHCQCQPTRHLVDGFIQPWPTTQWSGLWDHCSIAVNQKMIKIIWAAKSITIMRGKS